MNLYIDLLCDPLIPSVGVYIQEQLMHTSIGHLQKNVHKSFIHNSPKQETIQMSINRRIINNLWYIYRKDDYSTLKKKTDRVTQMNVRNVKLDKRSQTQKNTYGYDLIYMKFRNDRNIYYDRNQNCDCMELGGRVVQKGAHGNFME